MSKVRDSMCVRVLASMRITEDQAGLGRAHTPTRTPPKGLTRRLLWRYQAQKSEEKSLSDLKLLESAKESQVGCIVVAACRPGERTGVCHGGGRLTPAHMWRARRGTPKKTRQKGIETCKAVSLCGRASHKNAYPAVSVSWDPDTLFRFEGIEGVPATRVLAITMQLAHTLLCAHSTEVA